MEQDKKRKREPVYSLRLRAGKRRTYFFDVRPTKSNDFYLTITESKKRYDDEGYERHKLFLYKEDFNKFMNALEITFDHVKGQLMPDYDFDEFTREIKDDNIQENPEAIPDDLDVPANRETAQDEATDKQTGEAENEDDDFEVSFDTGTAASDDIEDDDGAETNYDTDLEEEASNEAVSAEDEDAEEKDDNSEDAEEEDKKKKDDNSEDAEKW